jgi:hypothetical protein
MRTNTCDTATHHHHNLIFRGTLFYNLHSLISTMDVQELQVSQNKVYSHLLNFPHQIKYLAKSMVQLPQQQQKTFQLTVGRVQTAKI